MNSEKYFSPSEAGGEDFPLVCTENLPTDEQYEIHLRCQLFDDYVQHLNKNKRKRRKLKKVRQLIRAREGKRNSLQNSNIPHVLSEQDFVRKRDNANVLGEHEQPSKKAKLSDGRLSDGPLLKRNIVGEEKRINVDTEMTSICDTEKSIIVPETTIQNNNHVDLSNKLDDDSSPANGKLSFDTVWPDGDFSDMVIPAENFSGKSKIPYFGWTYCQNAQKTTASGAIRRWLYCLGVFKCAFCDFVAKPLLPPSKKKKLGAAPQPPKHTCPVHPNKDLLWLKCNGGNACRAIITYGGESRGTLSHMGHHNHPKPPIVKPSPNSLKQLEKMVLENPEIGPAKLHMGSFSRKSPSEIDDAFFNKDRVKYHRNRVLERRHGPLGIRGSLAALISLAEQIGEPFFDIKFGDPSKSILPIIHMQSQFMRDIANSKHIGSSFQSDTIEGVVSDIDHLHKEINIHFTSAYDTVLGKWVPILMSFLFGRSHREYYAHW